jgi:hypothetical protein
MCETSGRQYEPVQHGAVLPGGTGARPEPIVARTALLVHRDQKNGAAAKSIAPWAKPSCVKARLNVFFTIFGQDKPV